MKKSIPAIAAAALVTLFSLGGCAAAAPEAAITPSPEETAIVVQPSIQADPMVYCAAFAKTPEMLDYPDFVNSEFDQATYDSMKTYVDGLKALAPPEIVEATNDYAIPVDAFTAALASGESTVNFETTKWKTSVFEILTWCVEDVGYSKKG